MVLLRRIVVGVAIAGLWIAATVLGLSAAALRTPVGRRVVVDWGVRVANAWLRGSLTVGEVDGSFFRGLEIRDFSVRAEDGSPVITAEMVGLQYGVVDLLKGRLVFGSLKLVGPEMYVVQYGSGEPLNLVALIPGGDGGGGPSPLVAFGRVSITGGSVVVMAPAGADGVLERLAGPLGDLQVRRFEGLEGELGYLRVVSPEPDAPILAEFEHLRTTISDPALDVRDLRGTVQLWGDSVALDLSAFVLPETRGRVEGFVRWPDGPLLLDLRGQVSPGRTDDLLGLVPGLPAGLVGDALFSVRSDGEDVVEFSTASLDLQGQGGGEMRGALGMRLGPGERWAFDATDLEFTRFDLEYFRGFLDTLPFTGRLTGRVAVSGPAERLQLTVDGTFFDYTVAERPVSSVLGAGYVSLAGDDFVFERFHVEQADIALATVRRLVPSVILKGRLWASGMLDGSWLNATFDGGLEYADPPLPRSEARGVVRLDSRADTVGMWATLTFDSLRLEGFHSSFPGFDLAGSWGGRLELSGFLSALSVDADLEGPAGSLRGAGAITALDDRKSVHDVRIDVHAFDLERLKPTLPQTRLDGHVEGAGGWDQHAGLDVAGRLALGASTLSGVEIEQATAWLALSDSVLKVDSLDVTGYGFEGRAAGSIAMAGDRRDTLTFTASSDSIGALEPIVASWLGAVEEVENGSRPSGVVEVSGRMVGSLDAFQLVADIDASRIRRGDLFVSHGGGAATWVSSTATLRLDGLVDSVALGALALGRLQVQLHGRRDSLQWQGRSRIGFGAWLGGGTWTTGPSTSTLGVDSLVLSLSSGPWLADPGAIVTLADSALTFQDLRLRALRGPGTVTVGGRWPFRGPGALDVTVDAFPVADVLVLALRDPYEASGELNGTLSLVGTARSPIVDMGVSLRDGAYREFRAPYTQGVLHYRDRQLTGDLELWRQGEQMLKVTLTLPLDLALAGAERRRLPGPIRLRARADSVQLALFEAITPSVRALGGRLDADFGIEGTWENPELAGSLVVHHGAATLPALGVRHEAMNGSFRLAGDTITVENLSVRSGTGTVDVRGFVRLEELSRPVLALRIVADGFRALDIPGFLTLTASGDVELRGPLFQARLTGQGTATQGVLYFADLLRKDIVNLEDTLFAQFVDTTLLRRQGLETRLENRFLDSLRIDDMRVEMGRDFWMRSSEANVQLGGAVLVNKVRDRYRLDGTLQALRGTYRLQMGLGTSREFAVTRGEIRYLGTPDLNADLDIDARHEVRSTRGEDVAVFVNIGGSLYDPRLTLTSDIRPALSEPEIISYLLFGAPTLAAGASQSGFGSRLVTQQIFGVLSSQIEYSLITDLGVPLDYIQIRPTTTLGGLSGAEFALGKQFRVFGTTAFLTASPRICRRERFSLEPGAGLEFRLNRNWIVSASVDPLTSCEVASAGTQTHYQFGADLFWEKRY